MEQSAESKKKQQRAKMDLEIVMGQVSSRDNGWVHVAASAALHTAGTGWSSACGAGLPESRVLRYNLEATAVMALVLLLTAIFAWARVTIELADLATSAANGTAGHAGIT